MPYKAVHWVEPPEGFIGEAEAVLADDRLWKLTPEGPEYRMFLSSMVRLAREGYLTGKQLQSAKNVLGTAHKDRLQLLAIQKQRGELPVPRPRPAILVVEKKATEILAEHATTEPEPEWLSVPETAARTTVGSGWIYARVSRGQLESRHRAGRTQVKPIEVRLLVSQDYRKRRLPTPVLPVTPPAPLSFWRRLWRRIR